MHALPDHWHRVSAMEDAVAEIAASKLGQKFPKGMFDKSGQLCPHTVTGMSANNPGLGAYSLVQTNLVRACRHEEHLTVGSALHCFAGSEVRATTLTGSVSLRENQSIAPELVPILTTKEGVEIAMHSPEACVFLTPTKITPAEHLPKSMEKMQEEIGACSDLADSVVTLQGPRLTSHFGFLLPDTNDVMRVV
jgi:hypothetical protein